MAKNERQRLQNVARAQATGGEREERKKDIEKTLASTRISTASMGKFDRRLEGEKKLGGVKRKVSFSQLIIRILLTVHSLRQQKHLWSKKNMHHSLYSQSWIVMQREQEK